MNAIFMKVMRKISIIISVLCIFFYPVFSYAEEEVIITDPTPDTTGPELKSLSISSNEASPGSHIKIIADVTDDLSGVASVYINFKLPSGKTNGYYLYLDQSTNKFQTTINFGTYFENGDWTPSYVSLVDKKDNSTTVQDWDWSTYTIHASGGAAEPVDEYNDKVPPVLKSINLSAAEVKSGQSIKLTADAKDDDSGISYIYVDGSKPSGRSFSFYLYFNSVTGLYEDSLSIDQFDELGDWKINYVTVMDNARNKITVKDGTTDAADNSKVWDFSNYKFTVTGTTPDLMPPILGPLAIHVEQGANNNAVVNLSAPVRDALSGVSSFTAYYQKPNGRSVYVYFQYNSSISKYEGSIPIDKYDLLGTWKLTSLSMYDNKGNSQVLYRGSTDLIKFTDFDFTVRGVITTSPVDISGLTLNHYSLTLQPGQTEQLKVTLNYTDGSTLDVTNSNTGTVYSSSNPAAVKVDGNGLITVNPEAAPGKVTIEALNKGKLEKCEITIPGAEPQDTLIVSPININLYSGQTKQLAVTASFSDGTVKDVTTKEAGTTYTSSDESKVHVTENGLIEIPSSSVVGKVTIKIQNKGITTQTTVNIIGRPVLEELQMNPKTAEIAPGKTIQLSVKGYWTDSSTKDLTGSSTGTTYISSDESRAVIDSEGVITIPNTAQTGTVYVTAINNGKSIRSTITVTAPTVNELVVSPSSTVLKQNETQQLTVQAKMSDGTIKDVTKGSSGIKYSSNLISRARITEDGLITIPDGATSGDAVITISYRGESVTTVITIPPSPTVESLELSPLKEIMKTGETQQLQVKAKMTDGEIKDVTLGSTGINYTSNLLSRAKVSADGLITIPSGATGGPVTITASYGGKTATITITVPSPPTVDHIEMVQTSSTMKQGETQQLGVQVVMTDGQKNDVTLGSSGTTYSSNLLSRAKVSADGLITIPSGATGGPVTITASYAGKIAATTITVSNPPTLDHIELVQTSSTMKQGEIQQLGVQAVMTDGQKNDVTLGSSGTTYSSNLLSRAKVSADGLITIPSGATGGPVTITASYAGKTAVTTITVPNPPTLDHIELVQTSSTMKQGETQQLGVQAVMTDGQKNDVTLGSSGTTYSSNLLSRAKVSADGLITIPSGATGGPVTITASYAGKTAVTTITVPSPPTVDHIELIQTSSTMKQGETQQLEVQAVMTDGQKNDVTLGSTGTTYSTSLLSRAKVSADGLITIPSGATGGPVTITVNYGGKTATSTITVPNPPTVDHLELNQINSDMKRGETQQILVTAVMTDGSKLDTTGSTGTKYVSNLLSRATVTTNGLITIPASATNGLVTITVTYGGKQISITLNIVN